MGLRAASPHSFASRIGAMEHGLGDRASPGGIRVPKGGLGSVQAPISSVGTNGTQDGVGLGSGLGVQAGEDSVGATEDSGVGEAL